MPQKIFKYWLIWMLFFFLTSALPAIAEIVFIGNMRSVPDELTIEDIESIFLGKKISWHDKTPVKMVLLTKAGVLDAFTREYTKKPKHLFKRHWRRLVFSGTGLVAGFQNGVYRIFKKNFDVEEVIIDTSLNGRICWQLPTGSLKFIDFLNLGYGIWKAYGWDIKGHIEQENSAFKNTNESLINQAYSFEYAYKRWHIVYEYQRSKSEDRFQFSEKAIITNTDVEGWYISGAYRFSDTLELGACYSEFFPDANDKRGKGNAILLLPDFLNWLYDTSFTLRIDVNENWITKLEYHYMDGFGIFNPVPNSDSPLDRYWHMYVIKISYLF